MTSILQDKAVFAILAFFSFWLGACVASFLNVVIWRVPRGESIVSPPSHCPKCDSPIRWYQNIPILSWLALRGKCAKCGAAISPRYILIELLGGALFLAAFWLYASEWVRVARTITPPCYILEYQFILSLLVAWIWISLMIAGSFIDFDHQLLPDFVTVGGMILGLAANGVNLLMSVFPSGGYLGVKYASWLDQPFVISLIGLALGFGLMWLIRFIGTAVFKREAMGMGDVFLMGAVGAICGPVAVLMTLMLSSLIGSVVGVGMILMSKAKLGRFVAIPFGPYLCLGCLVYMFFGNAIINWYLNLLRV